METRWGNLIIKITIWLAAEVFLTAIGIDDIADYSEFLIHRESQFAHQNKVQIIVS